MATFCPLTLIQFRDWPQCSDDGIYRWQKTGSCTGAACEWWVESRDRCVLVVIGRSLDDFNTRAAVAEQTKISRLAARKAKELEAEARMEPGGMTEQQAALWYAKFRKCLWGLDINVRLGHLILRAAEPRNTRSIWDDTIKRDITITTGSWHVEDVFLGDDGEALEFEAWCDKVMWNDGLLSIWNIGKNSLAKLRKRIAEHRTKTT